MACGSKHLSTNYIYTLNPFVFSSSFDVDSFWHKLNPSSHRFCICFLTYIVRLSHFAIPLSLPVGRTQRNWLPLVCWEISIVTYQSSNIFMRATTCGRRGLKEPEGAELSVFAFDSEGLTCQQTTDLPFARVERHSLPKIIIVQCRERSDTRSARQFSSN